MNAFIIADDSVPNGPSSSKLVYTRKSSPITNQRISPPATQHYQEVSNGTSLPTPLRQTSNSPSTPAKGIRPAPSGNKPYPHNA
jgi:hypothetical protein